MSDKKISDLTSASSVGASDLFEIEQSGVSKQATFNLFPHASLASKQGGTTGEYYHLSLADYTSVQNLGVLAFSDSVAFPDVSGLVSFGQTDRTTTTVAETATITLAANTKIYTTASGTLTTIAFSGGANVAQARRLELDVTGGPYTLTIPTCRRLGDTGAITSINVPDGYHEISWEYINGQYVLADSISTSGTLIHNDLTGKQGGAPNEFYHLTISDYTNVQNLGALAFENSLAFSDITGLASFGQWDRTTTVVSETSTVTLAANTKIYTTASGTLTTIAFSGGASVAQARRLNLYVTGGPYTLTIPTCQRVEDTAPISSISATNGYHELSWEYVNGQYVLADSITAATGTGDFSSNTASSVDSEIVLFSGTAGKTGKRATTTGIAKLTSGVLSAASAGTDYADNAFKTIVVSGQSNVVADTAADTLTLVAGSGMAITTDASTDTVTLSASGAGLGDFSSNTSTSVDSELVLFSGTAGKTGKRATTTGIAKVTSGVLSAASAGADYADNAFKTIAVSGQSDVVADSASDTLTIVAGTGMTITTNASTDTITVASSGSGSGWDGEAQLTGSNFTTSSNTLSDVIVSDALVASTVYEFESLLEASRTADTSGTRVGMHCSVATAATCYAVSWGCTTSANGGVQPINAVDTAIQQSYITSTSGHGFIRISGFIKTGSSGTPTISVQANAPSGVGTTTIYIGSILRWRAL